MSNGKKYNAMVQHPLYNAVARNTDPDTSWEAAAGVTVEKQQTSQDAVLLLLRERGPLASFQLEMFLADRWSGERVRAALTELERLGLTERTDDYRKTPAGYRARVWKAVEKEDLVVPDVA